MMCSQFKEFLMNFSIVFLSMVSMLVGVGFFTLLERKSLSYIQDRKGPNKLGIMGIFQPLGDGLKLFSKEIFYLKSFNYFWFYLSSLGLLLMCFFCWLVSPFFFNMHLMSYGVLYLLCCLSLISYLIMIVGWSSNSLYSNLGAMRSVAQIISYEISMILIILSCLILIEGFNLNYFFFYYNFSLILLMIPIYLIFFISVLAELNRTPFDLIEGESELVSGFNTEYYSGLFALIFLSEYGMILLFSYLITCIFIGISIFSLLGLAMVLMISFFVVVIRGALPRIRYDELMYMCWKIFLPVSLLYFFYVMNLKVFLTFVLVSS